MIKFGGSCTFRTVVFCLLVQVVAMLVASGCRSSRQQDEISESRGRQIALSRKLNQEGMGPKISLDESIELFRRAVEANAFNGAAHNNLGVALLKKEDYFGAATHFEQAIRLVPSNPDARVNLGLVYERVGQLRNAGKQFDQALAVTPEYLPALQAAARVRMRTGQIDSRTIELLRLIRFRALEPEWQQWAGRELARLGLTDASATTRAVESPDGVEEPSSELFDTVP